MKITTSHIVLRTDKLVEEDASKLRGYIGRKFSEFPILHHHIEEVGFLYSYPRIQYKVFDGTPSILGIEEGAKVLKEISNDLDELILGSNTYKINQKVLFEQALDVGDVRASKHYKFLTPWLAFNSENYRKYREIKDWKEKKDFVNSIIIGNVLSMCKAMGMTVKNELFAHSKIKECEVKYKSVQMIGFLGEFKINFNIPDLFGIGKGVSQGYGTIKNIETQASKTCRPL